MSGAFLFISAAQEQQRALVRVLPLDWERVVEPILLHLAGAVQRALPV